MVFILLLVLYMLLRDLHIRLSTPPTIWCDNLGVISLVTNPIYHARTKHIEVDYHFICEKVINRDVHIRYMSTVD